VEEGRRLSCWSEVVVAGVRHWTVTVGNGATYSEKHSTCMHEARQGEEDEVNGEVLGAVRRPAGRAHARRRLAHARAGACPGQRGRRIGEVHGFDGRRVPRAGTGSQQRSRGIRTPEDARYNAW
jgi:hypothetical protein